MDHMVCCRTLDVNCATHLHDSLMKSTSKLQSETKSTTRQHMTLSPKMKSSCMLTWIMIPLVLCTNECDLLWDTPCNSQALCSMDGLIANKFFPACACENIVRGQKFCVTVQVQLHAQRNAARISRSKCCGAFRIRELEYIVSSWHTPYPFVHIMLSRCMSWVYW